MPSLKRRFGDWGEETAVNYLKKNGYEIIERNWRCARGEIDIVAAKTEGLFALKTAALVFVEVKTIRGDGSDLSAALAAQNVHAAKKERLIRAANLYLLDRKIPASMVWRIDIVLVVVGSGDKIAKIEHLESAVWG